MRPVGVRLAIYAGALLALFGAGFAAGTVLGPVEDEQPPAEHRDDEEHDTEANTP